MNLWVSQDVILYVNVYESALLHRVNWYQLKIHRMLSNMKQIKKEEQQKTKQHNVRIDFFKLIDFT